MGLGLLPSFKLERRVIGGILKSIDNIWDHLNVEIKHHDKTDSGTLQTTPFWIDITDIASGITGSETDHTRVDAGYRDGDKIRLKTVNIKGRLASQHTATTYAQLYIVKYYDNFQQGPSALGYTGTGPKTSELLNTGTGNGTDYMSMLRNPNYMGYYKILASRRVRLSGSEDKDNEHTFNMFHSFKKRVGSFVEYEGPLSNSPANGKLYFVSFGLDSGGTAPSIVWSSRVTYVDN